MIDSTIVRAHQHSAGAKRGGPDQGLGRSRGGLSTKIHLRSNGLGLPVAVVLTGGQVSDVKGFNPLMSEPGRHPKVMIGDQGYDANHIRDELERSSVTGVIPPKRNRKVQDLIDGYICATCNLVERCFSKLKHSRRLATRYDKAADSFLGFVIWRRSACGFATLSTLARKLTLLAP